jgi:integrase
MLGNSFCRDSDSADSTNKRYFRSFGTMHSSHMLREGARPEIVRDILGHANIDVTQNVYGESWWEERVDAVTQAV